MKITDLDEIWYTNANLELGDRLTKSENFSKLKTANGSHLKNKDKISFIHIDKRNDQPNSITVNIANNQMNRTTTYVGPISLIHTHAFSTNTST